MNKFLQVLTGNKTSNSCNVYEMIVCWFSYCFDMTTKTKVCLFFTWFLVKVCIYPRVKVCIYPRVKVCIYPRVKVCIYPRVKVCIYPSVKVCIYPSVKVCISNQIKSNQITFIVTSPQHKCLGEWNSYERAPDSAKKKKNLHMDSTYLQTVQKTMCKIHIHILSTHSVL